jgi:hypothetical protein
MSGPADDDNVRQLPVIFKQPSPEERSLVLPHEVGKGATCLHVGHFIVDGAMAEVECGSCGAKLNPMWVLVRLASDDRRWEEAQKRYQDEMGRLAQRERTTCQHCGRLTRISRR